jgi:hypothetical protein
VARLEERKVFLVAIAAKLKNLGSDELRVER